MIKVYSSCSFHPKLADPKDMHFAEKARLEMLLRKIDIFEWARWPDPILQAHHPSDTASQSRWEGQREAEDG